ncbi:hypothetical protein PAXINDRAFT_14547 [Paxillus involutus ATCC 200175]|uniref:Uncharacterized protein n=1 Tax=Paxillus involutus ATCC 200175 TaxID=664439 RepID=A0A0C9TYJ0_PAXIN|nr:hypothetical protein PAXINDRAFT_14547 [Paxillus involutus ATCC 200175]
MYDPGGDTKTPDSKPPSVRLEGESGKRSSRHVKPNDVETDDDHTQQPSRHPVGTTDGDERRPSKPTERPDEKEGERGVDGELRDKSEVKTTVETVENVETKGQSEGEDGDPNGGTNNDEDDATSGTTPNSKRVEAGPLADGETSQQRDATYPPRQPATSSRTTQNATYKRQQAQAYGVRTKSYGRIDDHLPAQPDATEAAQGYRGSVPEPPQSRTKGTETHQPSVDLNETQEGDDNPCASRWKNMKDDHTARMWGIFDETSIFMAICHHGFSLVIADMVQSGEREVTRAKYPLAVVSRLLNVFGAGLGGGYDIGCKFKTTLDRSPLGTLAHLLKHTSLVGSFHGHTHGRLCQLMHLTTYVEGLGLKDLEGCERTFSKSNALAPATWYAGVFHRCQAIAGYFEHNDNYEIYEKLSTFLLNNYKQALNILSDGHVTLPQLKRELGITDDSTFHTWLAEEQTYLKSREKEPEVETLHMTYWQKLINLDGSKAKLDATQEWSITSPGTTPEIVAADASKTAKNETARRHAQDNYDKDLMVVQELERKLDVDLRWTSEHPEWKQAGRMVAQCKYQRTLDTLELLVVARIFELGRMNRAGTGYKLRKHIGKVLQARSSAIQTALDHYNTAAHALSPPRATLTFEDVIEYAFLADFDLLRDTLENISERPWAVPVARLALDTYFKMRHAKEEITRLNVEVRCFVTYLQDEDQYLRGCEELLHASNPAVAHQVKLLRNVRFLGMLAPGISIKTELGESVGPISVVFPLLSTTLAPLDATLVPVDTQEDLQEEAEDEETAKEYSRALEDIVAAASGP